MIIAARFVVPIASPPIENGAVQFENGIITAVGQRREVPRKVGEELIDYGDAVILPGFINAHTHLELTHFAGKVAPTPDFAGWLAGLMREFAEHPPTAESVAAAVREGARQSLAAGVTAVGDITRFPQWSRPALTASGLSGVSFGEVVAVGKLRDNADERLDNACRPMEAGDLVRAGISPHSPYTVEPELMRRCAAVAAGGAPPICVHAAESREEVEFLQKGTGPLRDFLESIGAWDDRIPVPACSPIELLAHTGLLTPRTLIAHANYVSDSDIALIAKCGASVVYCPRTHAAFGHPPHGFKDMLAAGINVCLGTDSLASNPSLSILDEIKWMSEQLPGLDTTALLQMATIAASKALQLPGDGSLVIGNTASIAVLDSAGGGPPSQSVVGEATRISAVYARGGCVKA